MHFKSHSGEFSFSGVAFLISGGHNKNRIGIKKYCCINGLKIEKGHKRDVKNVKKTEKKLQSISK